MHHDGALVDGYEHKLSERLCFQPVNVLSLTMSASLVPAVASD